jgi:thiol-disulfide isomerase/thioredoxin
MKKLIIAGVILAIIIGLTAFYLTKESDSAYSAVKVSADGVLLPAYEGQPQLEDPALTMIAPSVTGQDHRGNRVDIKSTGKPSLIIFLAHWCPNCNREVPRLVQDWREEGLYQDVIVHTVLTSISPNRPNYPPHQWLEDEGWPYDKAILDDSKNTILTSFGGVDFPYFVLLDGNHRVIYRFNGEAEPAEIRARINKVQSQPEPVGDEIDYQSS